MSPLRPTRNLTLGPMNFELLSEEDVLGLLSSLPKKSCKLDPMPMNLLIRSISSILPVITMMNMSLQQNCFPDVWKEAIVQSRLKKVELDASFANLRPVSNLAYISKLTEKAVFRQLHKHMASNNLYPTLQSAYRKNHNTESSLLKVFNDILLEMNNQNVTLLVFLDLSAAFDTIDHNILIARLNSNLGISEPALSWFKEYLSDRSQRVSINGSISKKFIISSGVPQGRCLGLLLFIIYASDLFKVLNKHSVKAHAYADDSQLYLSFKPGHIDNQNAATNTITNCIKDIQRWMT